MIRLRKLDCPQVLQDNAERWTQDLISVAEPTVAQKTRYSHSDIKQAIILETHGKCAYCESKIRHIDDGDIEHIRPKSIHPAASFDWHNLTLACTICNRFKGDYTAPDGSDDELIDPYRDDPADHFLFHKEILTPAPESLRAHKTDEIIRLNRSNLREKRRELMEFVHGFITAYAQASDEYKPLALRQLKNNCLGADKEFSAFAVSYIDELIARGTLPADIHDNAIA